ncbi:MAG: 2-oxoacid:acceptor oxidoreductase subunit alpha [Deltaproteobacteria bacterium]|nr:2-oxoacid:acceptor oxidoreductase subunit alpha [Deltaproteobacteria bacterium]
MKDLNVVIAGSAGEGIQTIGEILSHTLCRQGYSVFAWQEYESRIRGGQNSYSIRVGEEPNNAPLLSADILLALNEGAAKKYEGLLKEEGVLISQNKGTDGMIAIPFDEIAKEEVGGGIYANTVAVGALINVLGVDLETLNAVLERTFSEKGEEVLKANYKAAEKGFERAERDCGDRCPWTLPPRDTRHAFISGNEAIPIAAAYAGCRFISAYPMTPSTGIITALAKAQERFGVFAEQAEDEIAAINMALGAGYGGARAMTATSGGGFALMVEGISLAGMTETPLVIVLGQRPGPATGLPTRTAQGDLLFAINAGHGEFPKMVLAASDPKDAFQKTVRAFNMADKYQIPVILLTDQLLADAHYSFRDFENFDNPVYHLADPSQIEEYKRYQLSPDGISPRLYPGQSGHLVCVDSDEHDEEGHITEDLSGIVQAMVEKRLAKFQKLRSEVNPPEEVYSEDVEFILVGWGSSRPAILEGIELLKQEDIRAGMIHFTELWPLPEYHFPEGVALWTVENNATGQLARLLRSEFGLSFEGTLHRYDGLPLTGEYIRSQIHAQHRNV